MGKPLGTEHWRYSGHQGNEARPRNAATIAQHRILSPLGFPLGTSMTGEQADHNRIQVQFLPGYPISTLLDSTEVLGRKYKRYDPSVSCL
jgi:hypothetical protein